MQSDRIKEKAQKLNLSIDGKVDTEIIISIARQVGLVSFDVNNLSVLENKLDDMIVSSEDTSGSVSPEEITQTNPEENIETLDTSNPNNDRYLNSNPPEDYSNQVKDANPGGSKKEGENNPKETTPADNNSEENGKELDTSDPNNDKYLNSNPPEDYSNQVKDANPGGSKKEGDNNPKETNPADNNSEENGKKLDTSDPNNDKYLNRKPPKDYSNQVKDAKPGGKPDDKKEDNFEGNTSNNPNKNNKYKNGNKLDNLKNKAKDRLKNRFLGGRKKDNASDEDDNGKDKEKDEDKNESNSQSKKKKNGLLNNLMNKDSKGKVGENIVDKAASKFLKVVAKAIMTNPGIAIGVGAVVFILLIILIMQGGSTGGDSANKEVCKVVGCEGFTLKETPLSEKEFKDSINYYYEAEKTPAESAFSMNAGTVYDVSKEKGINPELVVAMAISMKYSPGDSYNYWQLGCENGECSQYGSFEEGIRDYIESVAGYETTKDYVMEKTSLGEYWYKEGTTGVAACGMLNNVLREYLSLTRANEITEYCNDSSIICSPEDTSGCKSITSGDNEAYATYLLSNLSRIRNNVFGIEDGTCKRECERTVDNNDNYWWPIGSSEVTEENGKKFAKGTPVSSKSDTYPDGVSSYFGPRVSPTSGASTNHGGIDIPVVQGTPIIASRNGTVVSVKNGCVANNTSNGCDGLGNYVKITHDDGAVTTYGHAYEVIVSDAEYVSQGQVIAYVGTTGTSTGNHLHFAMQINGSAVDPLEYVSLDNPRPENYEDEVTSDNWTTVITATDSIKLYTSHLGSLLNQNDMTNINSQIYNAVVSKGVGSRSSIVASATIPLSYVQNHYSKIIPYTLGGGHGGCSSYSGCFGVDYWSNSNPDCSSWASWVLNNAGLNTGMRTSQEFFDLGDKHSTGVDYVGKPGDLIGRSPTSSKGGHVAVIVGVDSSNNNYYISHAGSSDVGVVITTYSMDDTRYDWIIDMTKHISNNKISNYITEYENILKNQ